MWRTSTFRFACAALLAAGAAGAASAHPPRGIAVGRDGSVYFSDLERIWKIEPAGRLRLLHEHRGVHTHELVIGRSGELVGEDSLYDPASGIYRARLWSISPSGRYRVLFGPATARRGVGVIADARGCRYRVDQTGRGAGLEAGRPLVHRRCPRRGAERLVGSAADERAVRPVLASNVAGVVWAPDGSLLFRQGTAVRAIAPRGAVRMAASNLAGENYGIAVDRSGALYVAEGGRRRIVKVAPSGTRTVAARSAAPWSPTGVAVAGGKLYVLEASDYRRGVETRMRVRKIARGAKPSVLATVTVPGA